LRYSGIRVKADEPGMEMWRLVRSIYRTALKRLNARLAKERITFPQYSVLLALARNGPMPMTRLGEEMLVAPANVTGLVDRMEKKGYVMRKRDPKDRRSYVIEPTELGDKVFQSISVRFRTYVRSMGDALSHDELSDALSALQKTLTTIESTKEI